MILYHGTNVAFDSIDLNKSKPNKDFGKGFYLSADYEQAMAMAQKIASKAPIAVRYSKEAINTGIQTDMDSAIAIEANLFGLCFASEDQKEGMAAFLKKEAPQFKNR